MKIGTIAHKELFCRSFQESYRDYEPEKLPWPELEDPIIQSAIALQGKEEARHSRLIQTLINHSVVLQHSLE